MAGAAIGGVAGLIGGAALAKVSVGSALANTGAAVLGGKTFCTIIVSLWQHAEQILRKVYLGFSKAINSPRERNVVDSLRGKFAR